MNCHGIGSSLLRASCAGGLALSFIAASALPAMAYVGPGPGLSMIGALLSLILAVGFIFFGLVMWPLRALRRRRAKATLATADGESEAR